MTEKDLLERVKAFQNKTPGLGFPSNQWFSDHLPVGGIFKFND
jgi:hypothetical protein